MTPTFIYLNLKASKEVSFQRRVDVRMSPLSQQSFIFKTWTLLLPKAYTKTMIIHISPYKINPQDNLVNIKITNSSRAQASSTRIFQKERKASTMRIGRASERRPRRSMVALSE